MFDALKKYAVFKGRATRREFWLFILLFFILVFVGGAIERLFYPLTYIQSIILLGFLCPFFAVCVRRLHDIGRSGWWLVLLLLVPIVIPLFIIFFLLPSKAKSNKYGKKSSVKKAHKIKEVNILKIKDLMKSQVFVMIFIGFTALTYILLPLSEKEISLKAEYEERLENEKARIAEEEERKAIEKASKEAEEKRKGYHCFSSWDGSHAELEKSVKRHMNDPKSYDHIETRITPADQNGMHVVIMEFSGKNAFGGTIRNLAQATMRNSDCYITNWYIVN